MNLDKFQYVSDYNYEKLAKLAASKTEYFANDHGCITCFDKKDAKLLEDILSVEYPNVYIKALDFNNEEGACYRVIYSMEPGVVTEALEEEPIEQVCPFCGEPLTFKEFQGKTETWYCPKCDKYFFKNDEGLFSEDDIEGFDEVGDIKLKEEIKGKVKKKSLDFGLGGMKYVKDPVGGIDHFNAQLGAGDSGASAGMGESLEEDYKPLTAYNGSAKKFDKFSDSTKGETIGTDNFDIPGIYFSDNKDLAKGYACGETVGSYVDDKGEEHTFKRSVPEGYVYTVNLNYKKPIIIDYKKRNDESTWAKREKIAKNITKYKEAGYDIAIIKNIPYSNGPESDSISHYGDEYVVLDPSIIDIVDTEHITKENKDLEETIEKHDTLNPKLFDTDGEMKEEVRDKLLEIADKFMDNLKEDGIDIKADDIQVIGSNASYNYNDQSDIDLHIFADLSVYPNKEDLAEKLYNAYRSMWNDKYSPTIGGLEVEVYVEPSGE